MVKIIRIHLICLIACLFVINIAQADLYNRGMDDLGNRLIYDDDLNITWYDYTNAPEPRYGDTWNNQMNWASNLTVNFGGSILDDWMLPVISDIGHLYTTELGNISAPNEGYGLYNRGPFQNLNQSGVWNILGEYWSVTGTSGQHMAYSLLVGQANDRNDSQGLYAIAIRSGDVSVVPEPISSILFFTGSSLLIGRRYFRKRSK